MRENDRSYCQSNPAHTAPIVHDAASAYSVLHVLYVESARRHQWCRHCWLPSCRKCQQRGCSLYTQQQWQQQQDQLRKNGREVASGWQSDRCGAQLVLWACGQPTWATRRATERENFCGICACSPHAFRLVAVGLQLSAGVLSRGRAQWHLVRCVRQSCHPAEGRAQARTYGLLGA